MRPHLLLRRYGWLLAVGLALAAIWLLPLPERIVLLDNENAQLATPRFRLDPPAPAPGETVTVWVTDTEPWSFVQLTVDGKPAHALDREAQGNAAWTWGWTFTAPETPGYALRFFRDCHTGCIEQGRLTVGAPVVDAPSAGLPTKLGVVFPSLERDWHGRRGWVVEVTYARQAEAKGWGVDDLAARVAQHRKQHLRVLVRVDYDENQALPPAEDYVALSEYLAYLQRLARDARLQDVHGFIISTGFNTDDANALAPDQPVTPAWYARLFNGYGEDVAHTDNAVQTIHAENAQARVLVGPVRAWNTDQAGAHTYEIDVPWLNYMHTLVALLDETAQAKAEAGIPDTAPDGFDVQAPGRPDAREMAGVLRADEPRTDLRREAWAGAQAGFRIYEDWLAIINAYLTTRGLPVYVVSTNTYDRQAGIPPAQNYPAGWLTTALDVVNDEPQIKALCWFLDDFPHDTQWDWFSLTQAPGRLVDAAEEFDALLRDVP